MSLGEEDREWLEYRTKGSLRLLWSIESHLNQVLEYQMESNMSVENSELNTRIRRNNGVKVSMQDQGQN